MLTSVLTPYYYLIPLPHMASPSHMSLLSYPRPAPAAPQSKVPVEPGMPPAGDEHVLCDDNRFIADLAYDFKQAKAKDGAASKLLFKKRMFRETDETVTEPQYVNLSYIQAQHDYL